MPEENKNQVPQIVPKIKTVGQLRELIKELPDTDEIKFGCLSCGYDYIKDAQPTETGLILEGEVPAEMAGQFEPIYRAPFTKQDATAIYCAMEVYVRAIDDLINRRPVTLDGSLLNPDSGMVLQRKVVEILERLGMLDKSKIIKPKGNIILPGGGGIKV
jgi:hypothetical protein